MASLLWSIVVMNRSNCTGHHRHHQGISNNNSNASSPSSTSIVALDWDEWDESLWTEEQRKWLESGSVPREVYVTMSVVLSLVFVFGLFANSTILYVFSRFKRLRTPANILVINLTVCDLLSCLIHPMAIYSAYRGRWSFGKTGCHLYATCIGFLGINSIVTLSAIACERYIVITSSSCRPAVAKWRITKCQAQKICACVWIHCAALVAPPLLFGWSSYEPEGVLVTCSWDYTTRTLSNRLYYLYLLFFGFFLPVSVLTFCYAAIFRFIVRSSKEMTRLVMASHVKSPFSTTTITFRKKRRQTDIRTAIILLSLSVLCYTAWTPYAIVSLMGQFGTVDEDGQPKKLSALATSIPAFLAKTAIVFDPLLYCFSHPQFRSSIRQILGHNTIVESSNNELANHRGVGTQEAKAISGMTLMMVTDGRSHSMPRRPPYRNKSLATSWTSWARKKSEKEQLSQDMSDNAAVSSSSSSLFNCATGFSVPESRSTASKSHVKRASSLATVMWANKNVNTKVNGSSDAITRVSNGQEDSYRCFLSSGTTRMSSVIQSMGDPFFFTIDGAQHLHSAAVHYAGSTMQQQKKKKKSIASRGVSSAERRSSEPDLIRQRVNPSASSNLRSFADLTVRRCSHEKETPIFVVVSLPTGRISSAIDKGNLSSSCSPIDSGTARHPLLSSARSATNCANLSQILLPNKRDPNQQLFQSRRHYSLVFDSRINNSNNKDHQGSSQRNSLSCPLIPNGTM